MFTFQIGCLFTKQNFQNHVLVSIDTYAKTCMDKHILISLNIFVKKTQTKERL